MQARHNLLALRSRQWQAELRCQGWLLLPRLMRIGLGLAAVMRRCYLACRVCPACLQPATICCLRVRCLSPELARGGELSSGQAELLLCSEFLRHGQLEGEGVGLCWPQG